MSDGPIITINANELMQMEEKDFVYIDKLKAHIKKLEAALKFYANPDVYKPHPHGLAFDNRDISYVAIAALRGTKTEQEL
jgi:hypothetical protein